MRFGTHSALHNLDFGSWTHLALLEVQHADRGPSILERCGSSLMGSLRNQGLRFSKQYSGMSFGTRTCQLQMRNPAS